LHSLTVLWDKTFQKYDNEYVLFKNCLVAKDGNYVVSGNGGYPDIDEPNSIRGQLIKFDSETGDTIWYK